MAMFGRWVVILMDQKEIFGEISGVEESGWSRVLLVVEERALFPEEGSEGSGKGLEC
jgi:hypothetical protein